ncbi:ATP-dependent DNA ligase [Sphingomonas sp.]|uniref:ATP-dependent DNA ligase n=1 Tax=Sphingomonas sp. TaxID=28214 RepID=UPI001B178354|nr:ATP-dependent DNA ligase [Sphingomonas sp.]MBO9711741.1 ATP-dependent DNA ligase [Sphingomonas sp.]
MADDPAIPAPMEAKLVAALPEGDDWQFEPKWDGFRALARREGDAIELRSKSGKPLGRYFPDVVAMLATLPERHFLLDGELIIPVDGRLSFAALQARLHPAASRVARLVKEAPAQLMLFDCLAIGSESLAQAPLAERRRALEAFHAGLDAPGLLLSPATRDRDVALGWLEHSGGALDGIVAKQLDQPYRPGERAMLKLKQLRTADCVVGGYRRTAKGEVASLLLGLYDEAGLLDHVGFTSAFPAAERARLRAIVAPVEGPPGFTGSAPGGPSRWNGGEAHDYVPLRHTLVAEVAYDQVTAGRFRHGTRFLRWRPDKAPTQCTHDQLAAALQPAELASLLAKDAYPHIG